ncbi:hypothetical protein LTS08_006705 [Lithohypha guttulata]|nr:hypothetical protein LTS08_006705 [Lithohypha guttulata]
MPSASARRPYMAVPTNGEALQTTRYPRLRKRDQQYNYKPIPLRVPFLICFVVAFATCIALIEVLLRSTIEELSPSTIATTSASTATTPQRYKLKPRGSTQTVYPRQYETTNCDNPATLPARMASSKAISSSLCQDFSASYKAHTANMSYPMQTEVSQWLANFISASSGWRSALNSDAYCSSVTNTVTTSRKPYNCDGTWTSMIDVLCTESAIELSCDVCTGFGSAWISNFALSSTILPVCGAWTTNVIDETTPTGIMEGAPSASGAEKSKVVNSATPSPTNSLPTITKTNSLLSLTPGDTATRTAAAATQPGSSTMTSGSILSLKPADSASITASAASPTILNAVQQSVSSKLEDTIIVAIAPVAVTFTSTNSLGQPETIITQTTIGLGVSSITIVATNSQGMLETIVTSVAAVPALVPSSATIILTNAQSVVETVVVPVAAMGVLGTSSVAILVTNAQGVIETITTAVAAVAGSSVTLLSTDAHGVVGTVTSQVNAVPAIPATIVITDSRGNLNTITTQIAAVAAATLSATVIVTDSLGVAETLVVAANQLVPIISTCLTTNSQGQVQTLTTVIYGLTGSLQTFTTTNAQGQTITVVSQLPSSTQSRYTTTTQYTSLVTTTNTDGSVNSFSAVVVETIVVSTPPAQTVMATRTSTARASATNLVLAKNEKVVNVEYSSWVYTLAMYIPPLYAVLGKAIWEMVFAAIKLIQPFERMNTELGSTASYSIFAEYLSSSISWDAFTSLTRGNSLPMLSGILYVVGQIAPPLYAASSTIKARSVCTYADGHQQKCDPAWVVDTLLLRVAQAIAGVCLLVVLLMIWFTRRSRSGIASDPSSLASLATLMNDESLLNDIQKIGSEADHSSYAAALERYCFMLDYHSSSEGQQIYGIMGVKSKQDTSDLPELATRAASTTYNSDNVRQRYNYHSIRNPESAAVSSYGHTSFTSRQRKHIAADICGFLLPLTLLALVLTFYLDTSHDALNRFFNSNTLAPKLLLVALATLSSLHLSHLERLIRISEPFRRLAANDPRLSHGRSTEKPGVPAETTVLITRSGTPYSTLPSNILLTAKHELHGGRMMFQTLMSITVILSDLNIIAVAGVPVNDAMTWKSYLLASRLSIALTAWIVLVYLFVLLWWRRTPAVKYMEGRSMSKGVGTVGGCIRCLCGGENGSDMVDVVVKLKEEKETWRKWDKSHGGEGGSEGSTRVWFGKTGKIGVNGRETWSLLFEQPQYSNTPSQRTRMVEAGMHHSKKTKKRDARWF